MSSQSFFLRYPAIPCILFDQFHSELDFVILKFKKKLTNLNWDRQSSFFLISALIPCVLAHQIASLLLKWTKLKVTWSVKISPHHCCNSSCTLFIVIWVFTFNFLLMTKPKLTWGVKVFSLPILQFLVYSLNSFTVSWVW